MDIKFFKVSSLPAAPEPDSFYFVEAGPTAETWLTDRYGKPKQIGNSTMISTVIASKGGGHRSTVVDTIADRNALSNTANRFVYVRDATADPEIEEGSALYLLDYAHQEWVRIVYLLPKAERLLTMTYSPPEAMECWQIVHNMNRYPNVSVMDSEGEMMLAQIHYIDNNTVCVYFARPTTGTAYLS